MNLFTDPSSPLILVIVLLLMAILSSLFPQNMPRRQNELLYYAGIGLVVVLNEIALRLGIAACTLMPLLLFGYWITLKFLPDTKRPAIGPG